MEIIRWKDPDLEIGHLRLRFLGDGKPVVQPVGLGRGYGGGQVQGEVGGGNLNRDMHDAVAFLLPAPVWAAMRIVTVTQTRTVRAKRSGMMLQTRVITSPTP